MNQRELSEFIAQLSQPKIKEVKKVSNVPPVQVQKFSVLEPASFEQYVGQEKAKQVVKIYMDAAKKEKRHLPNILFSGSAGLGKTTLAKLAFKDTQCMFVDGNAVNSIYPELLGKVIIDEIHNVRPDVCDSLNIMIDTGKVTVLACTTNPGSLPKALRSRFRTVTLFPYSEEDLVEILKGVLKRKKKFKVGDDALLEIAKRSRNTPRRAIQYLQTTIDMMLVSNTFTLSPELLRDTFTMIGVDDRGLLEIDYRYLAAFPEDWSRSVGLQYLSAVLGIDRETIEEDIEPYLMQLKLIDRTPRGRRKL